jgi:hypothetical protein
VALVLAALDSIGAVIWYSMLDVLSGKGGAEGCRRRRMADAGEMAVSSGSDDGGWRRTRADHELSKPIAEMGHSRGWEPGLKVSTMIIRPPQQGQVFRRARRRLR